MTEKLPTTSYIFVDRRKTGRGKSLPNRQRLIRRIKDAIRNAKPKDIDAGGVKSMNRAPGGPAGGGVAGNANPVKVTRSSLHEPTFHYEQRSGEFEWVLIGNDAWERGDQFPLDGEDDEHGVGGPGEDTEDDFVVNVSRSEFFDVFFEDCELPDLRESSEKELPEYVPKHAGFQKNGNPGQLSVKRSFKNSFGRRKALTKGSRDELNELQLELDSLMAPDYELPVGFTHELWVARVQEVSNRMAELRQKIAAIPYFEDIDLRYTKKEKVQVKAADAVFAMIMDVSGSMDEDKKRMSRKFFSLQYAFIMRKYPQTDLIFIAHTEAPVEMTEEEFFTSRLSGGTIVSPAYEMLHKIIKSRYDYALTNIYLSQASDGDNYDPDNKLIIVELEESGLMSKLRFMSYAQVGQSYAATFGGRDSLWTVLESIANTTRKLAMVKIAEDEEVFDAFHRIYKMKKKTVVKA